MSRANHIQAYIFFETRTNQLDAFFNSQEALLLLFCIYIKCCYCRCLLTPQPRSQVSRQVSSRQKKVRAEHISDSQLLNLFSARIHQKSARPGHGATDASFTNQIKNFFKRPNLQFVELVCEPKSK